MRLRAEKMEEQRLYQELKLRRMQERAHGGPAKTVSLPTITTNPHRGHPILRRSCRGVGR